MNFQHTEHGLSAINRIKNRLRKCLLELHITECMRVGAEKVTLSRVDFEEVKAVWKDMKQTYHLIDDQKRRMAKETEGEECWYDCGLDKGHKT